MQLVPRTLHMVKLIFFACLVCVGKLVGAQEDGEHLWTGLLAVV